MRKPLCVMGTSVPWRASKKPALGRPAQLAPRYPFCSVPPKNVLMPFGRRTTAPHHSRITLIRPLTEIYLEDDQNKPQSVDGGVDDPFPSHSSPDDPPSPSTFLITAVSFVVPPNTRRMYGWTHVVLTISIRIPTDRDESRFYHGLSDRIRKGGQGKSPVDRSC